MKKILVTGGAGYVGSVLIPKLLKDGHYVKVVDLYMYGDDVLAQCKGNPNLKEIKGDIRNRELMRNELKGCDTVIHLACISNDPSYELNPNLGKSINYDASIMLVNEAKEAGIKNFIYASTSSVYGVKSEHNVTEDLKLEPLTDYSKFKAEIEKVVLAAADDKFIATIIRPATVCGYSPRLRLDLSVNILTNHAINKNKITVFGGEQLRPNIHIEDMTDLYVFMVSQRDKDIQKKVYNVGYENYKMKDIAALVNEALGGKINIEYTATNDNRSYHISAEKIKRELGFVAKHGIQEAVKDLKNAFDEGMIQDPMTNIRYYNIKTMQAVNLS